MTRVVALEATAIKEETVPSPKKKPQQRFKPEEVEPLVALAKQGDLVARDELLFRFQRLAASLVHLCITGRPNSWSPSHKRFLQMFGGRNTDPMNVAAMLKKELSCFEKEELFHTGQLAILRAIERTDKNLAATVVICFKDEIAAMIKGARSTTISFIETLETDLTQESHEDSVAWESFVASLTEEEWLYAESILTEGTLPKNEDGTDLPCPPGLREKLIEWSDRDDLEDEDVD